MPSSAGRNRSSIILPICFCTSLGSLCVFWLLLTLGYQRLSSLLLALLFALHPMFVPMVAWVPTRGDLLLTIFVIVSFVLFIKSFRGNRPALVVWHGITFFLAFLSKETAVAVPALCLLYYYFELRKTKARKLIKGYFVVWLIAGAAWYYLHSALHVVGDNSVGLAAFIQNLRIMPELLGKFFVPARFQLTPLFSLIDTAIGVVAAALFAWLIVRMGAWADRKVQFGLLWALLCILPGDGVPKLRCSIYFRLSLSPRLSAEHRSHHCAGGIIEAAGVSKMKNIFSASPSAPCLFLRIAQSHRFTNWDFTAMGRRFLPKQ